MLGFTNPAGASVANWTKHGGFAPNGWGLVLAAVAVMVRLGFWQLDRLAQKEAMIARYSSANVSNGRNDVARRFLDETEAKGIPYSRELIELRAAPLRSCSRRWSDRRPRNSGKRTAAACTAATPAASA